MIPIKIAAELLGSHVPHTANVKNYVECKNKTSTRADKHFNVSDCETT